jgi:hypothetical protein
MGQLYPTGDILAVIDDRADAERAVQALKQIGVPPGDVDLVDGAWFVEAIQHVEQRRGLIGHIAAMVAQEEGDLTRKYQEEASKGHTIVVVHAERLDVSSQVVHVLAEHGARSMHHYGQLVITDL